MAKGSNKNSGGSSEETPNGLPASAASDIASPSGLLGDATPVVPGVASRWVEVVSAGYLGPRLLVKGDVTDDPDYVALIGDPRELVKEVKE